ncbi:MAG: hypothetical protein ILP23_00045 [Paludibacteraceae bacterium]|nr:hypothetical protein [Paludibacteraceae bacterium]
MTQTQTIEQLKEAYKGLCKAYECFDSMQPDTDNDTQELNEAQRAAAKNIIFLCKKIASETERILIKESNINY